MRYIVLFLIFVSQIIASVVNAPLKSVDELNNIATIEINKIDVGISGFIIHKIADGHEVILKSVTVTSFDKKNSIASLEMSDFDGLKNNSLPSGKWSVEVGDKVVLAFGYFRALLIAPNEEIYHQITKAVKVQWIHPDLFATILSLEGHPSPTKNDFVKMSTTTSVGLVYFYLNQKLYTVDAKSFKILSISKAPLTQNSLELPFYTRLEKINTNWWNFGEGSSEMDNYESYYYSLLLKFNPNNQQLISEMSK
ncbi:MAG: plasminogen-binding N-terminal domain-containing protein [Campylobacterota bacterium]|nr:plasminogen-binding N-terminal domain-containing protein [Campylobacterota bacterium]